jgi:hypothetical protein
MSLSREPIILTPSAVLNPNAQAMMNMAQSVVDSYANQYGRAIITQSYSSIHPYYRVNLQSIKEKLLKLLFPFSVKSWTRALPEGSEALPTNNSNLPELYTPLVFGFGFLLIASVLRGMSGTFSFEQVSVLYLKLVSFQLFTVLVTKGLFFIVAMPGSAPILTLPADLGVITVYLTVCAVVLWSKWLKIPVVTYCAIALFLWTIRTLNPRWSQQATTATPTQAYCFLGIAVVQTAEVVFLVGQI